MLTPKQIEAIANDVTDIYSTVESECIKSIVEHIVSGKAVTQASVWQMKKLNDIGALKSNLLTKVSVASKKAYSDVEALVNEALSKSLGVDTKAIRKGLSTFSMKTSEAMYDEIKKSKAFQKILSNTLSGCKDVMNLTGTRAVQASLRQYTEAINRAYLEMATGNYTFEQAVQRAVGSIGKSGIKIVDSKDKKVSDGVIRRNGQLYTTYAKDGSVRMYPLDSAIRRDLTTTINQSCAKLTLASCDEMECELVETSWHVGARPEHEVWQGKVFSLNPKDTRYPYFYAPQEAGGTGYGDMLGLCGINCYHSFNPYFEGSARSSQEGKPSAEENEKVYKEQQTQRAYERSLRSLKREQMAYQQANMTDKARETQMRVSSMSARYRQFLKDTGRTRVSMLDTVSGYQRISTAPPKASTTAKTAKAITAPVSSVKVAGVSQGSPMTFEQADELRANPKFNLGGGYYVNCQTCVVANELRRRGYDVEALPNLKTSTTARMLSRRTNKAWIDPTTKTTPVFMVQGDDVKNAKQLYDWAFNSIEEGKRYHIGFGWKGRGHDGHIICIDKIKGALRLYDPQCNRIVTAENEVRAYFGRMKLSRQIYGQKYKVSVELLRVDNLDFDESVVNDILQKATT